MARTYSIQGDDFWHNNFLQSHVVSSGRGGLRFEVHGPIYMAQLFVALINSSLALSPTMQDAITQRGNLGIRVYFTDDVDYGTFSAYRPDLYGAPIDVGEWSGDIKLSFNNLRAIAQSYGNQPGGELVAALAHEVLHSVYGAHIWNQEHRLPVSVDEVRFDPFYSVQADIAAEFHLAVTPPTKMLGIYPGSLVVSDMYLDQARYNAQVDGNATPATNTGTRYPFPR